MRIISGSHKGKRLQAPSNLPARPTTDFAKEGLFNILRNRIDLTQLRVLDLFAGIGGISFEFASRGALSVVAVDKHPGCVRFIQQTADQLDFPIRTIKSDCWSFLKKDAAQYDLIFMDPPYEMEALELAKFHQLIMSADKLAEDGLLIIEHSKHQDISELTSFLEMRRYGGSVFSIFQKEAGL